MRNSLFRWFVTFFDKPRNRFLTLIGLFFVSPIRTMVKSDVERMEKQLLDRTNFLGKIGLVEVLMLKSWEGKK